jgi:Domain of unknown function (DUF4129)
MQAFRTHSLDCNEQNDSGHTGMLVKSRLVLSLALLICADAAVAFGQGQPATTTNAAFQPSMFVVELRGLQKTLKEKKSPSEIAALRDALPPNWTVSTPERNYTISTRPLREQLTPESREKAVAWLDQFAEEVNRSSIASPNKLQNARGELDHILARPEYRGVRPPSAWELFRRRVIAWLERLLGRFFVGVGRHPIAGTVVFWLIVLAGVVGIAVWLFRFLVSRDRMDALQHSEALAIMRTWQEWIHLAREAAGRGDFREAVHSAYWAGIARLEDLGVVPKDRSKTPREYLRSVKEPKAGELLATTPVLRGSLTELTTRFERVWYANRGASSEDFQDSLRQLEALGCHLE